MGFPRSVMAISWPARARSSQCRRFARNSLIPTSVGFRCTSLCTLRACFMYSLYHGENCETRASDIGETTQGEPCRLELPLGGLPARDREGRGVHIRRHRVGTERVQRE